MTLSVLVATLHLIFKAAGSSETATADDYVRALSAEEYDSFKRPFSDFEDHISSDDDFHSMAQSLSESKSPLFELSAAAYNIQSRYESTLAIAHSRRSSLSSAIQAREALDLIKGTDGEGSKLFEAKAKLVELSRKSAAISEELIAKTRDYIPSALSLYRNELLEAFVFRDVTAGHSAASVFFDEYTKSRMDVFRHEAQYQNWASDLMTRNVRVYSKEISSVIMRFTDSAIDLIESLGRFTFSLTRLLDSGHVYICDHPHSGRKKCRKLNA